jgi:phosphomannomutase
VNKSIFKAYDIRGIYPEDLSEETVQTIGKAYAHFFEPGELIVGYDARHGSPELATLLSMTIKDEAASIGKNLTIREIGLSTTPMFYFLVNHFKASGGCMITASHNPKEYNGIKTVRAGAVTVSGTEILDLIQNQ